jgi:anti-sigma28 factor (negative regulator of flagellin synthesis)
MRIDPKILSPILDRPLNETTAPSSPGEHSNDATVVTLSSAAAAIQTGALDELVNARIEQIRILLQRGEYPIDLDKLASRIADDELARVQGES